MKILFDGRVLIHSHYTGVENYTKNIYTYLNKNSTISLLKPKTKNKYVAHLWNHFILPFKKGDILFCPANIAPIFVPKNKKLVLTLHDVAFLTYPKSFSLFFRYYYQYLIPKLIQRADKIITISQVSKNEIIKYYPEAKNKIEVIFLGLDTIYRLLPSVKKKNKILYVGSLNMRKNFISVIQAFNQISSRQYRLCIVGNFSSNYNLSTSTKKILEIAKKNPMISFLSNVTDDELCLLYNESKLFIFPSFYEGFGLPPLEAMVCGTPVITSNISSMPEICGKAAMYINPHSIENLTQKIDSLLNSNILQEEMIHEGLSHVKKFTWEKSAKLHMQVFQEVLKS